MRPSWRWRTVFKAISLARGAGLLPRPGAPSLKLLLVLEIAFAGIYLALTRSLLVIYLASIGFDVAGISMMVIIATALSSLASIILYRFPGFVSRRVKPKFLLFHALERVFWIPIVFVRNMLSIALFYAVINISSTFLGSFMNLLIYSSFDEAGVRDVTAKRSVAYNIMSIIGSVAAIVVLAALPRDLKFVIAFTVGSLVGLLSTLMLVPIDMSHLEGAEIPRAIRRPEQMFTISAFILALMTSGNLLGIVWTPYLMGALGAPDYLVAAMNFAATIAGILGSIFWAKRSFRSYRAALSSLMIIPILVLSTSIPAAHIGISAFNSFMFTGAGFLGNFLFARYLREFGAIRASIMLTVLNNLSQLFATPFGIFFGQSYLILFASVIAVGLISAVLAFLTVPEVAVVPEEAARTYSQLVYSTSLMGYSYAMETSKETILLTLRLLALAAVLILLYILYRLVFFLAGL